MALLLAQEVAKGSSLKRSRSGFITPNREYRMDYEVKNVKMEAEFKVCPTCGYKDGFHSMFKKEDDIIRWLFICPSCHEVFDIGFTI